MSPPSKRAISAWTCCCEEHSSGAVQLNLNVADGSAATGRPHPSRAQETMPVTPRRRLGSLVRILEKDLQEIEDRRMTCGRQSTPSPCGFSRCQMACWRLGQRIPVALGTKQSVVAPTRREEDFQPHQFLRMRKQQRAEPLKAPGSRKRPELPYTTALLQRFQPRRRSRPGFKSTTIRTFGPLPLAIASQYRAPHGWCSMTPTSPHAASPRWGEGVRPQAGGHEHAQTR